MRYLYLEEVTVPENWPKIHVRLVYPFLFTLCLSYIYSRRTQIIPSFTKYMLLNLNFFCSGNWKLSNVIYRSMFFTRFSVCNIRWGILYSIYPMHFALRIIVHNVFEHFESPPPPILETPFILPSHLINLLHPQPWLGCGRGANLRFPRTLQSVVLYQFFI